MNTLKDKTAIVGVGATQYYKRGESVPKTAMELAGKAVIDIWQFLTPNGTPVTSG